VVNGLDIYNGWQTRRRPTTEAHVTELMQSLTQRLRAAEFSASDLAGDGNLLREIVGQEPARQPWAAPR